MTDMRRFIRLAEGGFADQTPVPQKPRIRRQDVLQQWMRDANAEYNAPDKEHPRSGWAQRHIISNGEIDEAGGKPLKTKTREPLGFGIMPELEKGAVARRTARNDVAAGALPGKRAGAAKTRAKARNATIGSPDAARHMGSLMSSGMEDDIGDGDAAAYAALGGDDDNDADTAGPDEARPDIENLPAVISRAITRTGGTVEPEWHMVRHLPGYLQAPIRKLGRMVFGQFTDTPIEDIQVLATLVNPEHDVRGVMSWIRQNGIRDDEANIDFSQIMPGYKADVQLWNTRGYAFLLVHDMAGYYIYGFKGGRGVHLDAPPARPRLR